MEMKFWVLCLVSVIVSAEAKPEEDGKRPNDDDGLEKDGLMKSLMEGKDGDSMPKALAVSEGSGSGDGSGEASGEGYRSLGLDSSSGSGDSSGEASGDSYRSLKGTDPDGSTTTDNYYSTTTGEGDYNGYTGDLDSESKPDKNGEEDTESSSTNPQNAYRSMPLLGNGEGGSDNGGSDNGGLSGLMKKLRSNNGGSDNGGSDNGGSDNGGLSGLMKKLRSNNGGSDNGGSDNGGSGNGELSETLKSFRSDMSGNENENEEGGKQVTSVGSEAEHPLAIRPLSPIGMPRKDVVKMLKFLQRAATHRKKAEEDLLRVGDLFAKNGFLSENRPSTAV